MTSKNMLAGGLQSSLLLFLVFCLPNILQAQQPNLGSISGNFETDAQWYFEDTLIGAPKFDENVGSNSFMNLLYTRSLGTGTIRAGARFESYMPTMQGFLRRTGTGIPYRYAQYENDKVDVTLGHFYDQVGSGMIFRSYEQWGLGFDNAIDGARVRFYPTDGIAVKGFIGKMRNAFDVQNVNLSEGLVRGGDIDVGINALHPRLDSIKTKIRVGAGIVSRYQEDNDPQLILPENVSTYGGRLNISHGKFNFGAEYTEKINDPSSVNNQIYKPGNGVLLTGAYSQKGLGISVMAKRIDNMDFRAERSATFNNLTLNYLPPLSKQHTYRLVTLFPWATQPNGEIGFGADVLYKVKKGSKLGGKYGTQITFNMSRIHALDTTQYSSDTSNGSVDRQYLGYTASAVGFGNLYFQDINLEISRKFNKKWKGSLSYYNFVYDKSLFKQLTGFKASDDPAKKFMNGQVVVVDVTYKPKRKQSLRVEAQHMYTDQDEFGSWAMLLAEYNISPSWYFAAWDEYNYGNKDADLRIHYLSALMGYIYKQYRFQIGYGRQRQGVICVGGVCRQVPASNGFNMAITGSF